MADVRSGHAPKLHGKAPPTNTKVGGGASTVLNQSYEPKKIVLRVAFGRVGNDDDFLGLRFVAIGELLLQVGDAGLEVIYLAALGRVEGLDQFIDELAEAVFKVVAGILGVGDQVVDDLLALVFGELTALYKLVNSAL